MNVAADTPVSLISAGVGLVTPMLAMLRYAGERTAYRAGELVPRRRTATSMRLPTKASELGRTLPRFTAHTRYREPTEADRTQRVFDSEGLMDLSKSSEAAITSGNAVLSLRPGRLYAVLPQTTGFTSWRE